MSIRISASQIKTFQRCPRLWGYGKLEGMRSSSPATRFGNLLHGMVEAYLKEGKFTGPSVDEARKLHEGHEEPNINKALMLIANAVDSGLLPGGHINKDIEGKVEGAVWDDDEDVRYLGFLDLVVLDDGGVPVELIDHKTTSAWKWAQTAETLQFDPQISLYALHIMREHNLDKLKCSHIQYLTKGKATTAKVSTFITRAGAEEVLESWREPAKKIKAIYDRGLTLEQLPCRLSGCRMYGGCPHSDICTKGNDVEGKPKKNFMAAWAGEKTPANKPDGPGVNTGSTLTPSPATQKQIGDLAELGFTTNTITLSRKISDKDFGSLGIEVEGVLDGDDPVEFTKKALTLLDNHLREALATMRRSR